MSARSIQKSGLLALAMIACGSSVLGACSSSRSEWALSAPAGAQDAGVPDASLDASGIDASPEASLDARDDQQDGMEASAADAVSDAAASEDAAETDVTETDGGLADAAADAADGDGGEAGGATTDAGQGTGESICYFGDFDVDDVQEVACMAWPGAIRSKVDLQGLTGGYRIDSIARSPDGQRIAVSGRLSASSPARLVVYPLDGSGPPVVVATAPAADRTISRPAFSLSGSAVAFLADFDVAGAMALYVASSYGGAARRITPLPANAALDVVDFAWSRGAGSRTWLAYVGDLEQEGVFALWAADTSVSPVVSTPLVTTAALAPDRGVRPGIEWDLSGRVYYMTNLLDSNVWRVHSSDTAATSQHVVTDIVNADGQVSTYSLGVSRNGDRLAFAAEGPAAGASQVFVQQLGSALPSPLQVSSATALPTSTGVAGPAFGLPIVWNASDTAIACASDWAIGSGDTPNVFSAWTLSPAEAGPGSRILGMPQSVDQNVRQLAFSRSGSRLFVRGDLISDGVFELFSTDDLQTAGQDPTACRVEDVPDGGDVLGLEWNR